MKKPQLANYSTSVDFLCAYHKYRKSLSSTWTLGVWARLVETSSTSTLSKILKGERQPGIQLEQRIVVFLRLSQQEALLFKLMVRTENKNEDAQVRVFLNERILELRKQLTGPLS